ncbi:MAG: right-handed parallel beta-helix repeat-containing protein, partial [Betaproteobacteria bacterium]|nr:right-handed parallel beta-helix repeat-containing protein [Betaproteobacteria bacterium]
MSAPDRNNLFLATISAFILQLVATTVSAATLYVATTGSNTTGNGTQGNPWATIQFAINHASFTPGSEILVQNGDYAPFYVDKSGSTAALRYTVRANGSNVRILGTVTYDGRPAGIHVQRSYVTIDGFVVDVQKTSGDSNGIRSRGIRVSGLPTAHVFDVHILNNRVSNAGWVGISTSYAENVLLEGNEVSHSKGQHGIYVANSADGPIIRRNISHHNAWGGIQINADPEAEGDGIVSNAIVERNISYNNGIGGTDGAGGASFDFASIR